MIYSELTNLKEFKTTRKVAVALPANSDKYSKNQKNIQVGRSASQNNSTIQDKKKETTMHLT